MKRDNKYLKDNKFAEGNKPNTTSFKKGNEPWNKGVKGIRLSKRSEFKKGRTPHNKKPDGVITSRIDRAGKPRNWIKVDGEWIAYAKYIWSLSFGDLIKGDVIHHMNGITDDDRVDNLIAMPRADHPIFHSRWYLKSLSSQQLKDYLSRYPEL